ncbi:MAG: hypothetical protein ACI4OF_09820 [Falsigemmobacter intermedius]
MTISNELPDELLKDCNLPGDAGLMKALKIRLLKRMPGAELTVHPGCEAGSLTRRRNRATRATGWRRSA